MALGGASAVLLFGAIGRRRLPGAYLLYAAPSLGLLFFREMWFSPLMSVGRYVLVVFPCFIVIGRWLATRPRLAIATLAVSAILELVLLQYWVRWASWPEGPRNPRRGARRPADAFVA